MRFVQIGDDLIINIEAISWIEKEDYGYWLVHMSDGKNIRAKSEVLMRELEELCAESVGHRESSTGSTCVDGMKLTVDVFDREDCPEWAEYVAVDEDGTAYFFEREPSIVNDVWGAGSRFKAIPVFATSDWKNSLIKRPSRS